MAFCQKCGKELAEGAQFCASCGTPVGEAGNDGSKRVQKFEGEIRKCPNCGAVLESFQAVCPSCGFELRGSTKVASSVQKLADKIAELESTREEGNTGPINVWTQTQDMSASKTDMSIANLIKAFPVPNTIEEISEFMMLASSNIDSSMFVNAFAKIFSGRTIKDMSGLKAVSEAWLSKMEMMYKKASMSFAASPKFQQVKMMYDDKMAEIKKRKMKALILNPLSIMGIILIICIIMLAIAGDL